MNDVNKSFERCYFQLQKIDLKQTFMKKELEIYVCVRLCVCLCGSVLEYDVQFFYLCKDDCCFMYTNIKKRRRKRENSNEEQWWHLEKLFLIFLFTHILSKTSLDIWEYLHDIDGFRSFKVLKILFIYAKVR